MQKFMQVLTRNGEGQRDLKQLCEKLDSGLVIVEVGSYAGDSARIFLHSGKIKEITCVDMWEGDYDGNDICSYTCPMQLIEQRFNEYAEQLRKDGFLINKIKKSSVEASKMFQDQSLDLVYIDACHTYEAVKEDLIAWIPKVKVGGWITGHDFNCPMFPGVGKAVNEIVGKPDFLMCSGSWMKKKL